MARSGPRLTKIWVSLTSGYDSYACRGPVATKETKWYWRLDPAALEQIGGLAMAWLRGCWLKCCDILEVLIEGVTTLRWVAFVVVVAAVRRGCGERSAGLRTGSSIEVAEEDKAIAQTMLTIAHIYLRLVCEHEGNMSSGSLVAEE